MNLKFNLSSIIKIVTLINILIVINYTNGEQVFKKSFGDKILTINNLKNNLTEAKIEKLTKSGGNEIIALAQLRNLINVTG